MVILNVMKIRRRFVLLLVVMHLPVKKDDVRRRIFL